MWWYCWYNNSFRFDDSRSKKCSIGLGSNIAMSLYNLLENPKTEYTDTGN